MRFKLVLAFLLQILMAGVKAFWMKPIVLKVTVDSQYFLPVDFSGDDFLGTPNAIVRLPGSHCPRGNELSAHYVTRSGSRFLGMARRPKAAIPLLCSAF